MKPLDFCLGFYKKDILVYKGKDNEKHVDISFLFKGSYISKTMVEIQWYPEPSFTDGDIVGTLRQVNCIHAAYIGSFKDKMYKFCHSVESLQTFRTRVLRYAGTGLTKTSAKEAANENEHMDNSKDVSHTRFDYLKRDALVSKLRQSRMTESEWRDKNFLLPCTLKRAAERNKVYREKIKAPCSKGGSMK